MSVLSRGRAINKGGLQQGYHHQTPGRTPTTGSQTGSLSKGGNKITGGRALTGRPSKTATGTKSGKAAT